MYITKLINILKLFTCIFIYFILFFAVFLNVKQITSLKIRVLIAKTLQHFKILYEGLG